MGHSRAMLHLSFYPKFAKVKTANHSAHRYIWFGQHSVILVEFECFRWGQRSSFLQPHTPGPRSVQLAILHIYFHYLLTP